MRNNRNNMQMPFSGFANIPGNMMMFPNYMNDMNSNIENRLNTVEKKIKVLENRISRLENPYQNNQVTPIPYQTTQNNTGYNGEMYMM